MHPKLPSSQFIWCALNSAIPYYLAYSHWDLTNYGSVHLSSQLSHIIWLYPKKLVYFSSISIMAGIFLFIYFVVFESILSLVTGVPTSIFLSIWINHYFFYFYYCFCSALPYYFLYCLHLPVSAVNFSGSVDMGEVAIYSNYHSLLFLLLFNCWHLLIFDCIIWIITVLFCSQNCLLNHYPSILLDASNTFSSGSSFFDIINCLLFCLHLAASHFMWDYYI